MYDAFGRSVASDGSRRLEPSSSRRWLQEIDLSRLLVSTLPSYTNPHLHAVSQLRSPPATRTCRFVRPSKHIHSLPFLSQSQPQSPALSTSFPYHHSVTRDRIQANASRSNSRFVDFRKGEVLFNRQPACGITCGTARGEWDITAGIV
jgi:hypothetical protein